MKFRNIQPISYLKTNTSDVVDQKTQDQLTMLRLLAHGRKQIEEGKTTGHDDFYAQLDAEGVAQAQRQLCERT